MVISRKLTTLITLAANRSKARQRPTNQLSPFSPRQVSQAPDKGVLREMPPFPFEDVRPLWNVVISRGRAFCNSRPQIPFFFGWTEYYWGFMFRQWLSYLFFNLQICDFCSTFRSVKTNNVMHPAWGRQLGHAMQFFFLCHYGHLGIPFLFQAGGFFFFNVNAISRHQQLTLSLPPHPLPPKKKNWKCHFLFRWSKI